MKDLSNCILFSSFNQAGESKTFLFISTWFNQSLIACVNEGIVVLAIKTWLLNNNKSSRKYFCSSTFYLKEDTNFDFYISQNSEIILLHCMIFCCLKSIATMMVFIEGNSDLEKVDF